MRQLLAHQAGLFAFDEKVDRNVVADLDRLAILQAAIPKEAFLWCKVVNAVSCGKTYEEVLTYATEHDIDLICMGASGTRFLLGVLFGSNTDRVLRQAPCPVLVARPTQTVMTQSTK